MKVSIETLPFDQRACFIAGQAKSGTTLMVALLDNHHAAIALQCPFRRQMQMGQTRLFQFSDRAIL